MKVPLPFFPVIMALLLLAGSCRKNAGGEAYPTDSLGKINRWVLDSMRLFYYWSSVMPPKPDYTKSPDAFFQSLLSKDDRFSLIIDAKNRGPVKSSYYKFGFHFAFMQISGYDGYMGVITFVLPRSPASSLGLQRGHCFLKVNGQTITAQNIEAVTRMIEAEATTVQLTLATLVDNTWQAANTVTASIAAVSEDPVYYTRTFTAAGKVTGYLFYNYFYEQFDSRMLGAFSKFRNAGISELILDLRYNMGGSVASSAKMAALIAVNLKATDIFAIYEGNSYMGRRGRTLQEVLNTSGAGAGKNYPDLQAAGVQLTRVFILTTKATASAAELIVNNLKPYVQVIQIGESTTGKDEASFEIIDRRSPRQVFWEIHPIVYKLFNKNNQGKYNLGLKPTHEVSELTGIPLAPVGEASDPLIKKALQLIYGSNIPTDPVNLRIPQLPKVPGIPVYRSASVLAEKAPPASVQY